MERVILRCLEREPRERPISAAAAAASLPGVDPLAAAIAAGETPSPQLVAASGDAGWLSPKVATACLGIVAVGLVVVAMLLQRSSLVNLAPLELKPAVLENNAKEIIRHLGYVDVPADSAFGFEERQKEVDYIANQDPGENVLGRWDLLETGPWPGVHFWYRQTPWYLFQDRYF